ncbi:alpha/beta hydrolase [uncultured Leifsonia sp.]|uniref:alpha/beta fold hydrolase n=1 Tax=Leifsonia sp. TaxID=1870902 RepID=UPI0028D46C3D|nr:alpha/beta hydrolase [uncultured Leifsonia sp.]
MTETNHTDLPASDRRRGTGPTLVFLHYWGGAARTWDLVRDRLDGRDSIAVDQRGWGRSRDLPGPYTLRRLADDALATVRDAGLDDYVLVGHSMGGKVAQLVAATRPDGLRGIVLVGPGPAKPAAMITPEYRTGLSHAYDSAESVAGARDQVLTASPLPEGWADRVVADSLASGADEARTEWPLRGIAEDISDSTRRIAVPALVVGGELDRVEPVEVLRDNLLPYLADATFTVLPGTGHLIPLEAPDALSDAIARFVATL